MRIVQFIDSLEAGGAERMAVTYANALSNSIEFSGLVATRNEGALKNHLHSKVEYLFLEKKSNFDLKAFLKFRNFIIKNNVQIIHAHGSSFFWATLLKVSRFETKIIWHDHFGNRIHLKSNTTTILKLSSKLFYSIITVNKELKNWAVSYLNCKRVKYLPNFIPELENDIAKETILKGIEGKRIVFLANLKEPKNHLNIIKAFKSKHDNFPNWTMHLIGKDYGDLYSKAIHDFIKESNLQNTIFIYDSCNDISNILKQSTVGVLGSTYEGFPVTLLEYGNESLIVMSTNVGDCSTIIKHNENGLLFDPLNQKEIEHNFETILKAVENKEESIINFGKKLNVSIKSKYGQKTILEQYLNFLK